MIDKAPAYPELVHNDPGRWRTDSPPHVGVDFEFDPRYPLHPTEMAISARGGGHTMYYGPRGRAILHELEKSGVTWVGHNSISTELPIIESELGTKIPLERMEDTMILHYVANAHLNKAGPKDEESEDSRGAGYMDLWSMASLYTRLPQWKRCRGAHCSGPCPVHDHLGYNGVDAVAVDLAYPALKADIERKRIAPEIITHVKRMMVATDKMTAQGIAVNRDLVRQLEREMTERKEKLFPWSMQPAFGKKGQRLKNDVLVWKAPFNPRGSQQIKEWFAANGLPLESTERAHLEEKLDDFDVEDDTPVAHWLRRLVEYKTEGKGLGPWFNDRYFHEDGLMHPRFIPTGTSTIRLSSADPNFQNIPKRGFGANVRRVVVPRDPSLILVKADKKQLELRMCLYHAGVLDSLPHNEDAFTWLVKSAAGMFEQAAESVNKYLPPGFKPFSERDMAKTVSHGGDYGEGIKILYGKELDSTYYKNAESRGAIVIYRDWEYHGGVVAFTGINLAKRFFKATDFEARRKALEIQEAYFRRFAEIRQWQKRVSHQAEHGYILAPDGSYLELHGTPEDKFKIALAKLGQGGGAIDVQESMIRYDDMGEVPLIQVHDELVFEKPRTWSKSQILDFFTVMSQPSRLLPGFQCPVDVEMGENWKDMTKVGMV